MKNIFLILVILLFINSCNKKHNLYLAKNYYEQGIVEAENGNFKSALQLVNKSIDISYSHIALALKATLLYQIKDFQESIKIFKQIINNKNVPITLKKDILNNYACNLLVIGKKNEAKNIWQELINDKNYLSPEVAFFNLGLLELYEFNNINNNNNLKIASNYFYKAIEISNDYVDAYFYLAITLIYQKNWQKAQENINKVLDLAPKHKMAQILYESLKNQKN